MTDPLTTDDLDAMQRRCEQIPNTSRKVGITKHRDQLASRCGLLANDVRRLIEEVRRLRALCDEIRGTHG
jgi:hypothetical protein